ncbi:TPA: hypothetical protein I8Y96_000537 [Legionella pneumophila]|nr:hypothetical protein [Legionella pneumophila]
MTKKHLSTFEREMQDPVFREQFEREYQNDLEKWEINRVKTKLTSKSIPESNSKKSIKYKKLNLK